MSVSRRTFLKGTVAGVAGLGVVPVFRHIALTQDKIPGDGPVRYVNSSCAICTNKCVFRGQVVNGVIRRLEPEPDFPKSRGMMCARGNAGATTPYDPDRLKFPLIRTGKRGEGKWKKVSWDEAFAYIAEKTNTLVKEEGGNRATIAFASSEGTYQEHYWNQFREVFGSPNSLRHPTLCLSSNIRGFQSVFGTYPNADVANSRYIILAGADRAEAFMTPDTIDMFNKSMPGRKLIYLDPRFTKTAAKADKWFPIKPGTDMAFALAMLNVIIGENLYDKAFVREHCTGFEELAAHVTQYTPEWAQGETGIEASEIRTVAREFAQTPGAVFYPGRRSSWLRDDVQTRRAIAMVNAVTGSFDRPGGLIPNISIPMKGYFYEPAWYSNPRPRLEEEDVMFLNPRDGSWIAWRDRAIKGDPYRIRGMFINKQNVIDSVPDRNKTFELFDKLDLIVTIDTMMSDTAWYSDVVLPESNYLERFDPPYGLGGIEPVIVLRQPLIAPMYDTRPCFDIVKGLAAHFEDEDGDTLDTYFSGTVEEHAEMFVSGLPGAMEMLREKGFYTDGRSAVMGEYRSGKKTVATPSKKIELYSEDFAGRGLDPMPVYRRPEEPGKGQFRFLVGRHAIHTHSMTAAFPELNWHMPENSLWINAAKAREMGIRSGDLVVAQNRSGAEVRIKAQVTEGIRPDCVYFAHGFGSLSQGKPLVYGKGATQAAILESHFEPVSGNACMHETFVEIRKA